MTHEKSKDLIRKGMTVGIIGGCGGMGRLFSEIFKRNNCEVLISDLNTPLRNADLALACDLVIVSVPISETISVINEIAPLMNADQMLSDFTSIKNEPIAAMLKSKAQVIGLHPMFGPTLSSISGQTIAVCNVRCHESDSEWLYNIFRKEGAEICEMTPEEHDRIMSVVQGLVHFATLSVAGAIQKTLKKTDLPLDAVLNVMSPVYRIEMGLIGRILGQDGALYRDILMRNPIVPEVLSEFVNSANDLCGIVNSGSGGYAEFDRYFADNREFFSDYIPKATTDIDTVIEKLAESK